ncbi:MAG: hypothetical protein CMQ24_08410 [Gammaproteobacteria bacterium]|nr:hypothetical protein [Gammaproteobacteria bacterium]
MGVRCGDEYLHRGEPCAAGNFVLNLPDDGRRQSETVDNRDADCVARFEAEDLDGQRIVHAGSGTATGPEAVTAHVDVAGCEHCRIRRHVRRRGARLPLVRTYGASCEQSDKHAEVVCQSTRHWRTFTGARPGVPG